MSMWLQDKYWRLNSIFHDDTQQPLNMALSEVQSLDMMIRDHRNNEGRPMRDGT